MRRGVRSQRFGMYGAAPMALACAAGVIGDLVQGVPWWKAGLALFLLVGLWAYMWDSWSRAKQMADVYGARLAELQDSTYHAITFADKNEVAAFVAALGQQMPSPREDLASYEEDLEISATTHAGGATLYLTDAAMDAVAKAFATATNARQVPGRDLPRDRVALLVGAPDAPVGRDDIIRLLDS